MGIDIYARWPSVTDAELAAQKAGFDVTNGHLGHLREAYHGEPYVTQFLVPEAFNPDSPDFVTALGAPIPAALLRARLPRATELAIQREKTLYRRDVDEHDPVIKSFADFVDLCERKEQEHGRPCWIYAWY